MQNADYQPVIGLEVHIQLNTNSKVFATEGFAFGAAPNHFVSPISLAHPGALPSINRRCVEHTIKLGLATNCRINRETRIARKNYFYPDLPKGYQMSQDQSPICEDGWFEIKLKDGSKRRIGIERIHLEEDAGKQIHDQDPQHTLVDLNRAGVGLMELVTRPDLRDPEEVGIFLMEIRKLVRYLDISAGDMEKGALRCDSNVSVMHKDAKEYGTRVEIKNLNSFNFAIKASQYEVQRQIGLVKAGEKVIQQTRTFLPDKGVTQPMRDKETADDYRYFPEPDLLPMEISEQSIESLRAELPELPQAREARYKHEMGLSQQMATSLSERRDTAEYFERLIGDGLAPKTAANWLLGPVQAYLNEHSLAIADFPLSTAKLEALVRLVESGKVTFAVGKGQLFQALMADPKAEPLALAEREGLLTESDGGELMAALQELAAQHPKEAERFRKGEKKLQGFFMGQLMRAFKGKAEPKAIQQVLREWQNEQ